MFTTDTTEQAWQSIDLTANVMRQSRLEKQVVADLRQVLSNEGTGKLFQPSSQNPAAPVVETVQEVRTERQQVESGGKEEKKKSCQPLLIR